MNRIDFSIAAIVVALIAGVAGAGVNSASVPTVEARNVIFGDANGAAQTDVPTYGGVRGAIVAPDVAQTAGKAHVGLLVWMEADDTGAYTGPGGATLDAGDEACGVFGLTCHSVTLFDPAGASGDEFTDTVVTDGCTDDTAISDNAIAFAICY